MNFVFYGGVSAVTYFLTKNVAARSTDALLSYIMNSDADANIKDHHTVKSIQCMLKKYKDMQDTHPAYESMLSVQEALKDLEDKRAAAVDYIYGMTKHSDLFKGLTKMLKGTDIKFQLGGNDAVK